MAHWMTADGWAVTCNDGLGGAMTTQRIIERIEGITGTGGLIAALQHLQDRAEKADIHMIAAGEQYAGIALELVQDVDDGELTIEFRADP